MPSTYQAPTRGDMEKPSTRSQTLKTNVAKDNTTVKNIIDQKGDAVFTVKTNDSIADAVSLLQDKGIGALVVTDANGLMQGILSERDIVRKLAQTPGETLAHKVSDVMTSNVVSCTSHEALVTVLQRMTDGRFRHMPVVDNGQLKGMVTIGDVVKFRLTELEHEALQLKQLIVG
ncbi:MAG: CBS domain-containing protein [Pseudomonadota bacterium]